jgi:hypothetical protein
MRAGHILEAGYQLEQGERTFPSAHTYNPNGSSGSNYGWKTVLYSTVQALLRAGCIEEERRWIAGEAIQGNRQWQRWNIRYRLKENLKEVRNVTSSSNQATIR